MTQMKDVVKMRAIGGYSEDFIQKSTTFCALEAARL